MQTLAYGLFRDRAAADAAVARLERQEIDDVWTIHEHTGELNEEEVQGPGTRSRSFALLGALFAAVLGGVLAAVLFGDRFWIGPVATGIVAGIAAGAFGMLAGIAGTALPRSELARLQRDLVKGRTLVTIDVQSKSTSEALQAQLERCGAIRTGVLYGPGLGSTRVVRRRTRVGPTGDRPIC